MNLGICALPLAGVGLPEQAVGTIFPLDCNNGVIWTVQGNGAGSWWPMFTKFALCETLVQAMDWCEEQLKRSGLIKDKTGGPDPSPVSQHIEPQDVK